MILYRVAAEDKKVRGDYEYYYSTKKYFNEREKAEKFIIRHIIDHYGKMPTSRYAIELISSFYEILSFDTELLKRYEEIFPTHRRTLAEKHEIPPTQRDSAL